MKIGRYLLTIFGTAAFCLLASFDQSIAQENTAPRDKEAAFEVSKAWVEFEDNFRLFYAYLERKDFDFEAQISRSRRLAKQATTREQFRRVLHQTTYAWTDPHLIVGPFGDDDNNIIPTSSDLVIELQNEKFVVKDVRAESHADAAGVRPGWQLMAVDDLSIKEAIKLLLGEVNPQPTPKQIEYAATVVANGRRKGTRRLLFRENGKTVIKLSTPRDYAIRVSELPPLASKRIGDIGVIRFNNSLGNNETIFAFDAALNNMKNTHGLILDLRNTPSGGNTEVGRSIIGHFVSAVEDYQIHEIPSLEREFTVPRRFVEQVKPRSPFYDPKRIVVLGGHWTGSMGEGIVIGMDAAADAFVIASDMADLLGALRNIELGQSGARLDLGSEALFHVDGTPREDFVADLVIKTSDRTLKGEDPAIEAALRHLSND